MIKSMVLSERLHTNGPELCRKWRRMVLAVIVFHLVSSVAAFAQQAPPPLGPPTYRSEKVQLGVGLLSGFVKTKVAEIVTTANQKIRQQTSKVTVEALPLKVFSPRRVATLHTNRPNQYYVKLPMGISVKVKIRFTSDRTIYIPFDLNLSCEGWHTGNGKIQIVGQTGPPSIEGGNIIEDVIMVRDLINNLIRSNLTLPGTITVPIPTFSCVTIGASPSQSVGDPFAFIAYDPPSRLSPIVAARALPTITVTFQKLKRLRARGRGAVLYQPTENVMLETYANFVLRQSAVLTMREDDEVTLTLQPSVVTASGLNSLVIIANIRHQPTGTPEDSSFAVSSRTVNFSPGIHRLQITKVYVEPPGPGRPKPLQLRVPAYELTYEVRYAPAPTFRIQ